MERVTLVCQHCLTVDKRLVVVLIVQRRSRRSTAADREVGLHAAYVVVLLASEHEETLQLTFTHTWLAILHDRHMRFRRNLTSPAHRKQLFIILDRARLTKDIMKLVEVAAKILQIGLIGDLSLQL